MVFSRQKLKWYDENLKRAFGHLNARQRDFLCQRYGVYCDTKTAMTLEEIGNTCDPNITRERVRQILNKAKQDLISQEKNIKILSTVLDDIILMIDHIGGILPAESMIVKDLPSARYQNILNLLLDCTDKINKMDENMIARAYYYTAIREREIDDLMAGLRRFCQSVRRIQNSVFTRKEMVDMLKKELKATVGQTLPDTVAETLLDLCKEVDKNRYDEYGHPRNPLVRLRGVTDYLQMTLRRAGKPMHYKDLAREVSKAIGRDVSPFFCLNSMSGNKDTFMRVGNGIYALSGGEYKSGTVGEVIRALLMEKGRKLLSGEEICDLVLSERNVKKATVLKVLKENNWFVEKKKGQWILSARGEKALK